MCISTAWHCAPLTHLSQIVCSVAAFFVEMVRVEEGKSVLVFPFLQKNIVEERAEIF